MTCACVHLQLQSDQDHGNGLVKYVLSGEGAGTIFVIDENNGDLHATRRLDREEKAFYILKATVVNKRTGQKLEPETEFVVKLHDINDNEPQFSKEVYTGSVPERSDIGKEAHCTTCVLVPYLSNSVPYFVDNADVVMFVSSSHLSVNVSSGTSVMQVTATDADDSMYGNSAKLVYSISQGHPYFSVDPNTGMYRSQSWAVLFQVQLFIWCFIAFNCHKTQCLPLQNM